MKSTAVAAVVVCAVAVSALMAEAQSNPPFSARAQFKVKSNTGKKCTPGAIRPCDLGLGELDLSLKIDSDVPLLGLELVFPVNVTVTGGTGSARGHKDEFSFAHPLTLGEHVTLIIREVGLRAGQKVAVVAKAKDGTREPSVSVTVPSPTLAASGGKLPFAITRMQAPPSVTLNGPHAAMTIWWQGAPTFPVTVHADTASCPAGLSCIPVTTVMTSSQDPFVWADVWSCTGAQPFTLDYWWWMSDAHGVTTAKQRATVACRAP